ncbi:hypothetical protein PBI_HYPERION_26 [Microbacterium phage Hyperion]|uniref:Uncharacterized protein n=1 Tax=Microbacterium phage Hyperion TaxID=2182354 RepID=A0A2U8UIU7_9CAUD|nr:hypothetical protein HOT27_gp026 [Microbacterium phage Hyperion]AWN03543.1 hypothetical protein PBI_HYPERION_26 [Microbacterium phage Hyperion]
MSPARIPEGSVFIPRRRGENVALQLLTAAEEVGADRDLSVRTVSGGYHVYEDVADRYLENLGVDTDDEDDKAEDESTETEKTVEEEEAEAAAKEAADKAAEEKEAAEKAAAEKLEPLPVSADNSHDEIDAYANTLDPKVEFPANTNKADKIALLEKARTPQAPAAE